MGEKEPVRIDLSAVKDPEGMASVLRQCAEAMERQEMELEPPLSPERPLDKRSVDDIMQFGQNMGLRRARDILLRGAELLEKSKKG
jgi:hypothetical protein